MTGSSEPKDKTASFMQKNGGTYPYAHDPGKLRSQLGISGYPSAVLVDPSGKVVWKGHPNGLKDELVASVLPGALKVPVYKWPEEASKVRKELSKRKYYKALSEAEKLSAEAAFVKDAIQTIVTGKVHGLERLIERGDFLSATELGEELEGELKGLPEVEKVEAALAKLKDDDRAQEIMKAQKKVRGLAEKRVKKGNVDRMVKQLEDLADEYTGTVVEVEAREVIRRLRAG